MTWDPTDSVSHGMLHGAILAGLALAQRKKSNVEPGDRRALQGVEQGLLGELSRLAKMDGSAEKIGREARAISEEVRKGTKALRKLADKAQATMRALEVEVREEAEEEAAPMVAGALPASGPTASGDNEADGVETVMDGSCPQPNEA